VQLCLCGRTQYNGARKRVKAVVNVKAKGQCYEFHRCRVSSQEVESRQTVQSSVVLDYTTAEPPGPEGHGTVRAASSHPRQICERTCSLS
jgi:hypothetical protein